MPEPFDDLTDVYEAMIDWPKRLAREEGFYRRLVAEVEARRVLDAACGTGQHAAMLHGWGLEVEGADLSPKMIELCRRRFGQPPGLRWVVRPFEHLPDSTFDLVLCVGNSLALAPDEAAAARAVRALAGAIRPGGILVVHVLNLWSLPEGPVVWQKCLRTPVGGRDALVLKGVHRCGTRGYVELVVADHQGTLRQTQSVPFIGLRAATLAEWAHSAGLPAVQFFGAYSDQPYREAESPDLVMTARRS